MFDMPEFIILFESNYYRNSIFYHEKIIFKQMQYEEFQKKYFSNIKNRIFQDTEPVCRLLPVT